MGVVAVPIKFLYSRRTIACKESAPQKECVVQMAQLHHQPVEPPLVPGLNATTDSLLIEEIRVLRERGLTDECIHGLFSGFNIDSRPETSGEHWQIPVNDQLIRLIWGSALPKPIHLD
jgi:hypothetical protein